MQFRQTELGGAYLISLDPIVDERGFFARAWCRDEFSKHGLPTELVQSNVGFSQRRGTLRGMHYQIAPHAECKLVRCTQGSVYDVIVDLRPDSPTYGRWVGAKLSAENRTQMFLPAGFAHGYQTLVDNSELVYHTTQAYHGAAARGARFDDPAFGIQWPLEPTVISEQDRNWPLLDACHSSAQLHKQD